MEIIKSKDNNKIKYVRSLGTKKTRDEENFFVVEGIKFVKEAISEESSIKFVLISENAVSKPEAYEIINILDEKNVEYYVCEEVIFNNVSDTINAQGVLAVVNKHKYSIDEILKNYNFIVFCDRIQDPGNLGTIIRTADAFGPAAVILNKGCVDAFNPKVVRASAGALFRVPFLTMDKDEEILSSLKSNDVKVVSAVVDSKYSFENVENCEKLCVVIGNEGQGISEDIIEGSDVSITIRMSGRAESLNASIAAGIIIYEIRKKLL